MTEYEYYTDNDEVDPLVWRWDGGTLEVEQEDGSWDSSVFPDLVALLGDQDFKAVRVYR
jgi:hypothetical protein